MRRRTFEEMIMYFNQTVSEMDIDRKYKMTLLGMVTALLQRHDEDVAQIVRCEDCKHYVKDHGWNRIEYTVCSISPLHKVLRQPNDFCSRAERRTDDR